eukprot:gb/GECG01000624.1/.p1 GENE.gb/GECG01000624.1/~~gb/GECG01000624.1/.p1  ORF type:complete len:1091 (+),score=162.54 gb/GECG01000624.1/:1-3273(+)
MAAAGAAAESSASQNGVDQNLYSRQIGVYGMETMGKLIQMNVLIVGMKSAGIEAAKNLILAGPRSVTIFDPETMEKHHLGYNYYLNEEDLGRPIADSCVGKLSELNNYVQVSVLPEKTLNEEVLDRFHVVVFTDQPISSLVRYNEYCRSRDSPIGFIATEIRGLAGRAFVDFGDKHKVIDPDGEPTKQAIIVGVIDDKDADGNRHITIQTHDSKRHGFSDGESVAFKEVEGIPELSDGSFKVFNCGRFTFEISSDGLPPQLGNFGGNGVVEQVKVPETHSFGSLQERLKNPVHPEDPMGILPTPDLGKFGRPEQLHVGFGGLNNYIANNDGKAPVPHNDSEITNVITSIKQWAEENKKSGGMEVEVDSAVQDTLVRLSAVELPALGAFFGGMIAQEIVKFTGKFTPLRQWLYLDAFELYSINTDMAKVNDQCSSNDRYHFSNVMFGKKMTERIRNQRVFIVGAGALGCEFLKNFALMGVGTQGSGKITVTDMDNIEVSNLNRQFLFRPKDVGCGKSTTAARAAMEMNPELRDRITALETAVGPDTENIYNEDFWQGLSFVTNALDNLKARQYVDEQCVWHKVPLLESGTLGTKANTQVVMPYLTESYSDQVDPPEESIPLCTLKNFPNAIEHCIEWSRDNFEGYFKSAAQDAKAFASNPKQWLDEIQEERNDYSRRQKLEGVSKIIEAAEEATWESCVREARLAFEEDYSNQIKQLLHNFPPDHVTADGNKFWSGPKRMPKPMQFDINDKLHRKFVAEAAAMFASIYGISIPKDYDSPSALHPALDKLEIPEWQPKSMKIKTGDDDDTVEGADDDGVLAKELENKLASMANNEPKNLQAVAERLNPAEFEKDDDTNHHIDFIWASANLRATNYGIAPADRHKVKMIAGKIVPAIATTTCMVTGLVMIEAYKVISQMSLPEEERKIEPFRNSFVNLGVNVYSMSEPGEPKRVTSKDFDPIMCCAVRAIPEGHSKWDRVLIHADQGVKTVNDFIRFVQNYISKITQDEAKKDEKKEALNPDDVDVSMVLVGNTVLYSTLYSSHKDRLNKDMKELYKSIMGEEDEEAKSASISISASAPDGSELATPTLQLFF